MKQPLVTVLMPVYNCSEYARGNGKILLTLALDSILAQTFENFEIILLDNQSTDRTSEICQEYAGRDQRVHYVLDRQKRTIDQAFAYLATINKSCYCFCANDDDVYHHHFIERLVGYLECHPNVDLVYPNCDFIKVDGSTEAARICGINNTYQSSASPFANFCAYALNRNPIPFVFGMYRSEAFRAIQPTVAFDNWGANVDNILILKFFLQQLRSHFVDETLFYYRTKHRPLKADDTPMSRYPSDFPPFDQPLMIWQFFVRHQLYFLKSVESYISSACGYDAQEKQYMHAAMCDACITHSINLLGWVKNDETKINDFENQGRLKLLLDSTAKNLPGTYGIREAIRPNEYELLKYNPKFAKFRGAVVRERLINMLHIVQDCNRMIAVPFAIGQEAEILLGEQIAAFSETKLIAPISENLKMDTHLSA